MITSNMKFSLATNFENFTAQVDDDENDDDKSDEERRKNARLRIYGEIFLESFKIDRTTVMTESSGRSFYLTQWRVYPFQLHLLTLFSIVKTRETHCTHSEYESDKAHKLHSKRTNTCITRKFVYFNYNSFHCAF